MPRCTVATLWSQRRRRVLPMNICQFRGVSVPPGKDRERRWMIANELAEEWDEQPQPMEFDFWEMDDTGGSAPTDGSNVGVLAVARPGSANWCAISSRPTSIAGRLTVCR